MQRFFVEGRHEEADVVTLDGSDAQKIVTVLRMRAGETVEIIDSAARRFVGELEIEGKSVRARLVELRELRGGTLPEIAVAQGIPKGQKMDFVVEKLSELGVSSIIPLESERAVVSGVGGNKIDRWRRLAKSAAQQCGRDDIARISEPLRFDALVRTFGEYDAVLFPWELADRIPLRERLPALISDARRILILVGPEGGFSHAEAQAAQTAGAHLISLGSRILRTETAALVLVSMLAFLTES